MQGMPSGSTCRRFLQEVLGNNTDTLWFGEIDDAADAAEIGVILPKMRALLFGAPGAFEDSRFHAVGGLPPGLP